MTQSMLRCTKCLGQKKIYKIGNGYSHVNSGGEHVKCPECKGEGSVKVVVEEVTKKHKSSEDKEKTLEL